MLLLVENNPDDRELAMVAFRQVRAHKRVIVCESGEEALDFLFGTGAYAGRDPSYLPKVVLLDLKLQRMDGLEVLQCVRADARTRRLPVVMLSSSREQSDLAASYDLGANSYIRKPVDFGEFLNMARQLVAYWLDLNEVPAAPAS